MAKKDAQSFSHMNPVGRELTGAEADFGDEFDPVSHEHADTDLEELGKLVDREHGLNNSGDPVNPPEYGDPDPAKAEQPAAEPEQPLEDEQPREDPLEEPEPQAAEAPEGEEPVEEPSDEVPEDESMKDQVERLARQLKIRDIRDEKNAAENERLRTLAELRAGQLGAEKQQQNGDPRKRVMARLADMDLGEDAPEAVRALQVELRELRAERESDRLERANHQIAEESAAFHSKAQEFYDGIVEKNGETVGQVFTDRLRESLAAAREEIMPAIEHSGSPATARKLAKAALEGAFADARIAVIEAQDRLADEIKADNRKKMRQAKRAASGVSAKGAKPAAADRQGPNPLTMNLEDLKKLVDSEHGVTSGGPGDLDF